MRGGVEGVVSDVGPEQVGPLKLEVMAFLSDRGTSAHSF